MDRVAELTHYMHSRGGAHHAGTFPIHVLRQIQHMLDNHFGGKPIRSVETGCGASTVLLSSHGGEHIVYCLDDVGTKNSSVLFARECSLFNPDKTRFIFGPTQKTLVQHQPSGIFDLVLIDGPHAFPFPEVEYFFFYETIRTGGVLIIDDVHIPTINHLFNVLRSDDMFILHSLVRNTAFFVRTGAPAFSREGDGWAAQRYNAQHFPSPIDAVFSKTVLDIPVSLGKTDIIEVLSPYVQRGFVNYEGKLTTEGHIAILQLYLGDKPKKKVQVTIEVTPIAPADQPNLRCLLMAQFKRIEEFVFNPTQTGARRITFTLRDPGQVIHLRLDNYGIRQVRDYRGLEDLNTAFLQLGVALSGIDIRAIA